MRQRVELTAAFVLHGRPYRETSMLVDFFTLEYGRITAVAKGVRRAGSRRRFLLQPFQPMQISWSGRHELKSLSQSELAMATTPLQGNALLCGLYVNELLQRLLQPEDPHPRLYLFYTYVLNQLASGDDIESALRLFERQLLEELGYELALNRCEAGAFYRFDPDQGLIESTSGERQIYPGHCLQAISRDEYEQADVRRCAKHLMREALTVLLGDRPLQSRALFQSSRRTT
ncbi:DNA repair protein RecO [Nitrincola sp. MINF-07-Sa-05]|uniref:DNA repair protein RecO n=1 Tax=Nitrincola salilacus TaxID=3400273 RepID=UPI00391808AA